MDNSDADSVSNSLDAHGHHVHVIKIYPLDGKSIAESQLWISVIQVINEVTKRLFLREGLKHRPISEKEALGLLSGEIKNDLTAILKHPVGNGRRAPLVTTNTISKIQDFFNRTNFNQIEDHNVADRAAAQNYYDAIGGGIHVENNIKNKCAKHSFFRDAADSLNTTSNSEIVISSLVQAAQFKSWGAIKVSGTEYFKRQVWLEAAAKGMYVEGYMHTEADRQALFSRLTASEQASVREEYKPVSQHKSLSKANNLVVKNIKNKPLTSSHVKNSIDSLNLSKEELDFFWMRVWQNDINNENSYQNSINDQPLIQQESSIDINLYLSINNNLKVNDKTPISPSQTEQENNSQPDVNLINTNEIEL